MKSENKNYRYVVEEMGGYFYVYTYWEEHIKKGFWKPSIEVKRWKERTGINGACSHDGIHLFGIDIPENPKLPPYTSLEEAKEQINKFNEPVKIHEINVEDNT